MIDTTRTEAARTDTRTDGTRPADGSATRQDAALEHLAADAYTEGRLLVANLRRIRRLLRDAAEDAPAPVNTVHRLRRGGVCCLACIDVSGGPLTLTVRAGGCCVLELADAHGTPFAVADPAAGPTMLLLVPPGWHLDTAHPSAALEVPTTLATLTGRGRAGADGPLPGLPVTGRNDGGRSDRAPDDARPVLAPLDARQSPGHGVPEADPRVAEELRFFEELRAALTTLPKPQRRSWQRYAPIGLLDTDPSPYVAAEPALAAALRTGLAAGRRRQRVATPLEAAAPTREPVADRS